MPSRLRRLLYSSVYYIADTRNARGQTGGGALRSTRRQQLMHAVWQPAAPDGVRAVRLWPHRAVCGEHRDEALATLSWLEESTR